jgi:non-lysosomal glucosylceramidase
MTVKNMKHNTKVYTKEDTQAVFPLGGIGTGNISINSCGHLMDFELFNHPDQGFTPPYTFFAIHSHGKDIKQSFTKVLEAEIPAPYHHSHGFHAWHYSGLPRFKDSKFSVKYPKAYLSLEDLTCPLEVSLEAFTPFIPLDADKSGIPGVYFTWKIKNTSKEEQYVSLAFSAANLSGWTGKKDYFTKPLFENGSISNIYKAEKYGAILMFNQEISELSTDYTEMGIAVERKENQEIHYKPTWQEGQWWDGLQDFWNDFSDDGSVLDTDNLLCEGNAIHKSPFVISTLASSQVLKPGETTCFKFILSWYHPNRIKSWYQNGFALDGQNLSMHINSWLVPDNLATQKEFPNKGQIIKNYYAHWGKPRDVLDYLVENRKELEGYTDSWIDNWFSSDVPSPILEAVSSNLSIIRSTTCFRVENGKFFAWEGCFDQEGSCPGNCTHVWNYAQTLAAFFPELERSMRETEYFDELSQEGKMNFRALSFLDGESDDYYPASDGQLGSIIRVYREWLFCGDDGWLRKLWPKIKSSIHFAEKHWDLDRDSILEAAQHNTYDIEFYGVSTHLNSIWLAALVSYQEMAKKMEEESECLWAKNLAEKCARLMDEECFNGEYYEQKIEDVNEHKYQYGKGCLSDQILGITWGLLFGLKMPINMNHIESASIAIFRYNFIKHLREIANLQRGYAFNDESGLILCSWPRGGKPIIPFVYSDEVWTGIEYSVATLLMLTGNREQGIELVSKLRNRYDGKHRNPWNEPECGNYYSRALACYGTYLAYCGIIVNLPNKTVFTALDTPGKYFLITGQGWGTLCIKEEQDNLSYDLISEYGTLDNIKIVLERNGGGKC